MVKSNFKINWMAIFFTAVLILIVAERSYNRYLDSLVVKTPAYYKDQSFQYCIDSIQRNTVYVITAEQIKVCGDTTKEIYDATP